MKETGIVESIDKHNFAKVVFDRKQACEHCQMCLQGRDKMKVSVRVKNTLDAKQGDRVSVEMTEGIVLKSAFVVYLIPVLLVLAALLATMKLDEAYQIIAFGVALVASVVIDIIVDKALKKRKKTMAVMTELFAAISETDTGLTSSEQVDADKENQTMEE